MKRLLSVWFVTVFGWAGCTTKIISTVWDESHLKMRAELSEGCEGVGIYVKEENRTCLLYANVQPRIHNGAPPAGFGMRCGKEETSFGVDGNVIAHDFYGYRLLPSSRIVDKNGTFDIAMDVRFTRKPAGFRIQTQKGVIVDIDADVNEACRDIYATLLSRPQYGDAAVFDVSYGVFLPVCAAALSDTSDSSLLDRNALRRAALRLVDKKTFVKLDAWLHASSGGISEETKEGCEVNVTLLSRRNLKKRSGAATFYVRALHKATYEKLSGKPPFRLEKGRYVIRALSGRTYGTSYPFVCAGKNVHLTIITQSGI